MDNSGSSFDPDPGMTWARQQDMRNLEEARSLHGLDDRGSSRNAFRDFLLVTVVVFVVLMIIFTLPALLF